MGAQGLIGLCAAGDVFERYRLHGVDDGLLAVAITHGGNIGDDEPADRHTRQGRDHGRLAPHGMTQEIDRLTQLCGHLGDIGRQSVIAVILMPRARSMVAHVQSNDSAMIGQSFGNHAPIAARAKKPVGDEQRRAGFGVHFSAMGDHM